MVACNFKPNGPNIKLRYLAKLNTINEQFWENVRTIKHKSWVVRHDVMPIPIWRTAAILKIRNTP